MDRLRLILLIVGVLLIAGIFVWELFKKRAAARRRAQLFEHLAEEEKRPLIGESVLGDIGQADPFEIVQRVEDRRSLDREQAVALDDYDIDEDFPGEPAEEPTRTPAPPAMAAPASDVEAGEASDLVSLGGFGARPDAPEQLDLAGLDLSAPARTPQPDFERRGSASDARGEGDERPVAAESGEQLDIVMTVMARSGERFSGEALRHALESVDLYHGDMNIFHRHQQSEDRSTPTLFSAANVLAPGYFDPSGMDTLSSPGIAIFMRLPGPETPVDTFQQMLDAATTVAENLNGMLCDETRSTLTPQSINHLRERIADFGRRQMLKA